MKKRIFAIIEIGSNNTKMHVYEDKSVIHQSTVTIEFKNNYSIDNKILESDLEKLCEVIERAQKYTEEIHLYGCSIFRKLPDSELERINSELLDKFSLKIEVVSQEKEAEYTALGCYKNVDKDLCVFIGGGGSIELLLVQAGRIVNKKYYDFGVVDVAKRFPSLKEDFTDCTFEEIKEYLESLITGLDFKCDVLVLAGGDHLYWYKNAQYELEKNTLYIVENQPFMVSLEKSDEYDHDCLATSLDEIRKRSDNPMWFNGSRAMKMITNFIAHKIDANYIIPTAINMEDGIKEEILKLESE